MGNVQWDREQVPERMEAVGVTAVSDECVQITWEVPGSNMLGVTVTDYTLRVVKAGGGIHGGAMLCRKFEAPRKQCCVDQLEGGTYYVSVCAGNGKWDGAMSQVSTVVVKGKKSKGQAQAQAASASSSNQADDGGEDKVEFIKVASGVDRAWKWYPAMKLWEQMPPVDVDGKEGRWPPRVTHAQTVQQQIPLACEIAASPSSPTSIEVMWQPQYHSKEEEGEVHGGCAPHKTYSVAVVCAATGAQVTRVYDSSVSDCCITGLGQEGSGSNGQYHVAVFASNGFSMGLLSSPVLVRLKGRKVPSSADNTFEFTIGGVRFRRPADL